MPKRNFITGLSSALGKTDDVVQSARRSQRENLDELFEAPTVVEQPPVFAEDVKPRSWYDAGSGEFFEGAEPITPPRQLAVIHRFWG